MEGDGWRVIEAGLADRGFKGEEEGEDGTVVGGGLAAADAQDAAMAMDDFFADPEAEAGAGDSLGGEEGVEDFGLGLGGHAGADVCDGDGDAGLMGGPVGGLPLADEEGTTAWHGVEGVADEVGEDLTNLSVEAVDFAMGAAAAIDVNARVADAALIDGEDGVEEIGDVDLLGAAGLAVKAEGLAGDGGGAAKLDFSGVEVAA